MTSRPTVLASVVLALALLGDSLLYAILPLHAATFGVSLAWVGVLLSANRVVRLFLYPSLARLAATGLRRSTIAAAALGAASTLWFALASGPWALLASRLAWGVAFGSLSLSALAYATSSGDGAGRRVGLSHSLREIGPLFSLTAGIVGVTVIGVRPALGLLGILSLFGVLVAMSLPEENGDKVARQANSFRWPGQDGCRSFAAGFIMDGMFPATIGLVVARSSGIGHGVIAAGIHLGFKRLATVVLAPVSGFASDRFGGLVTTVAGFATGAIGMFLIACDRVSPGAILLSCGAAVTATSISMSVAGRKSAERLQALARVAMARDTGAAAGPLVGLALFDVAGAAVLYAAAGAVLASFGLIASKPELGGEERLHVGASIDAERERAQGREPDMKIERGAAA